MGAPSESGYKGSRAVPGKGSTSVDMAPSYVAGDAGFFTDIVNCNV